MKMLRDFLPDLLSDATSNAAAWVSNGMSIISVQPPKTVDGFVHLMDEIKRLEQEAVVTERMIKQLHSLVCTFKAEGLPVATLHGNALRDLDAAVVKFKTETLHSHLMIEADAFQFALQLEKAAPELLPKIENLHRRILTPELVTLGQADDLQTPGMDARSQNMLQSKELHLTFHDEQEASDARHKVQRLVELEDEVAFLANATWQHEYQQSMLGVEGKLCSAALIDVRRDLDSRKKIWEAAAKLRICLMSWKDLDYRNFPLDNAFTECNTLTNQLDCFLL